MDLSEFLIPPFNALVALITLVGAALLGRRKPRLIRPFTVSTLLAIPAPFSMTRASEVGIWLFESVVVVLWLAVIGIVIGAILARATIAAVRQIRHANVLNGWKGDTSLMSGMGRMRAARSRGQPSDPAATHYCRQTT